MYDDSTQDDRVQDDRTQDDMVQDNRAETVLIVFPALRFASVPEEPKPDMVTPAQSSFETLLYSDQSSLALLKSECGDKELVVKLIILDLLRSSMPLWESFLRKLTTSNHLPINKTLAGYEEDLAHAMEFSGQIRDLGSCLSYLMASVRHYIGKGSGMATPWDLLSLEMRTSEKMLRNLVQRLVSIARPKFDFAVVNSNESQAIGVKRLTIIASIFLPLSLASTLMAMTNSVTKLGELWFDWVGLWLIIGFIVTTSYFLWKWVDILKARPLTGPVLTEVLEGLQSYLLPWLLLIFGIIVASFLVGMFDSLPKVRDALKYGAIAFAAFIALRLIVYYAFKVVLSAFGKWHGRRRISLFLTGCSFYYCLLRIGGSWTDFPIFFCLLISPYIDIVTDGSGLQAFDIGGCVGRVLRAAARSKRTKNLIQDEREFFQGVLEYADAGEDRIPKEVARKIREIAGVDDQVRELLTGIV